MYEIIGQAVLSIFTGFGGVLAVYALFKFVIKKWIESTIDKQMQKSLADYQKTIDRQNSSYNLRIQKEFAYFDLVQRQRYNIVSNASLFVSYMDEGNNKGAVDIGKLLISQFDDFVENYKSNEAYLSKEIQKLLEPICVNIFEFVHLFASVTNTKALPMRHYKKIVTNLIDTCENFRNGLTDYLITKEN